MKLVKQAISAHEWALYQLTVCLEYQSRSEGRRGHKNCTLQMALQSKVPCLSKMWVENILKQDHCRGVYLPPRIKGEEIPFPRFSAKFSTFHFLLKSKMATKSGEN